MESLGPLYLQLNTINSLTITINIMDHYQCELVYFMESFHDNCVNFISAILPRELALSDYLLQPKTSTFSTRTLI